MGPAFSDAVISRCGRYRYALRRRWAALDSTSSGHAVFIMLNPSTADAEKDDPTIRRCIDYAKQWGMPGLTVVNLFAWRATDPEELYTHPGDKIGPENDGHIEAACKGAGLVVAAWGNRGILLGRGDHVRQNVGGLHILKLTNSGQPAHPLYLAKTRRPVPWR